MELSGVRTGETGLGGHPACLIGTEASSRSCGAAPGEHAVQFYRDRRFLIETVHRFVAAGLEEGDGAVVLASAEHLAPIRAVLSARGLVPQERLVLCDAEELLEPALEDAPAARHRLRTRLTGLLERARGRDPTRRLRVHCELGDLIWRQRRTDAVTRLEELLGDLVVERGLRLQCAYCLTPMARAEYRTTFDAICARHASVGPTEAWRDLLEPAGRRSLASLEQRAAALEGELLRREWATQLGSELQRTTCALGGLVSEREAAAEVIRVGLAALGGRAGAVWLLDARGIELELVHEEGLAAGAVSRLGRIPASFTPPPLGSLEDALFLDPDGQPPSREPSPVERQLLVEVPPPVAILPLGTDRWQGALLLQARSLEPEERTFLALLAQSCSQAIERARAWACERRAREQAEAAHREATRLLERERIALDAAESAQQRTTFLLQACVLLASSLDWRGTLVALADLAVPRLADWCAIDVGEGDQLVSLAIAHTDPGRADLARRLRREHPPAPGDPGPASVMRSGEPQLFGEIAEEPFPGLAPADHEALLSRLGIRSALIVPMSARGRTFGTILLGSDGGRRFGVNDLELAELLGRRAGIAIDNARLYAEAQSATQAREEILAVVSHDLRNPLGAILTGAAGMLNLEITERKAARIRKNVETIHRAGERMARLINDLVDFASLQSGRLGIERGDCLVGELIDSTLEMFAPLAEERELRLEGAAPPDRPIHCDRDRVIQVLANLVANALKVTAAGGRVRVGAEEQAGAVVFSVEDTGPGIGPADLPHLFERYWRGKATYKGTGLGLAIARGIVEAHGGRIWAESQVGVGSVFRFTLSPARGEPAPEEEVP